MQYDLNNDEEFEKYLDELREKQQLARQRRAAVPRKTWNNETEFQAYLDNLRKKKNLRGRIKRHLMKKRLALAAVQDSYNCTHNELYKRRIAQLQGDIKRLEEALDTLKA